MFSGSFPYNTDYPNACWPETLAHEVLPVEPQAAVRFTVKNWPSLKLTVW